MPLEFITDNVFGAAHVGKARRRNPSRFGEPQRAETVYYLGGPELTQAHADVLMVALGQLGGRRADETVSVPIGELGRALARKGGAYNRDALWGLIGDLVRTSIESRRPGRWSIRSILGADLLDGERVSLALGFDMLEVMALGMVQVDAAARHAIGNRPLAQWLHLCRAAAAEQSITLATIQRHIAPGRPAFEVRRRTRDAVATLQRLGEPVRFDSDADAVVFSAER